MLARNLAENGARLNPTKSSFSFFSRRRIHGHAPPVSLHGMPLPVVPSARCVGLFFDTKLTRRTHVHHVRQKCARRLAFLRSLAGTSWGAHPTLLRATYQRVVRPVVDYGAGIYDPRNRHIVAAFRARVE